MPHDDEPAGQDLHEPDDDRADALRWFGRGALCMFSLPALILSGAFVGFAGFARESGVEMGHAILMTALVWALPTKVVLVAASTSGSALLATSLAVTLSSVRLMPMVSALVPEIRTKKTRTITLLFLAHFVAITAWVLAMERVPSVPRPYRVAYFAGIGITLTTVNTIVVTLVYLYAATLPEAVLGALFFLTPMYFLTSLWATARDHVVKIAMVFGLVLGPVFNLVVPGFDLLLAGIIGGTAAWLVGRRVPAGGGKT